MKGSVRRVKIIALQLFASMIYRFVKFFLRCDSFYCQFMECDECRFDFEYKISSVIMKTKTKLCMYMKIYHNFKLVYYIAY